MLIFTGKDIWAEGKMPAVSIHPFSSLQNSGMEIVPLKEVKNLIIPKVKEKREESKLFPWECLRTYKQQDSVPSVLTITHRQIPIPSQKLPVVEKQEVKKEMGLEEKVVDLEMLCKRATYIIKKSGIDPAKEQLRKARIFVRLAKDAENHQLILNYIERAHELVNSALEITTLKVIQ
ncbi:MAG: hypothetical protein QME40_01630 [bacterium]|nr:hypothetical protein [bacterium]